MFWRVQTAWVGGLHPTFMGREEALAKRDVDRLLRGWMLKNLLKVSALYMDQWPPFAFQAKLAADSIARLLDAGDVWGAYDAFHAFQDQFPESPRGLPIWLVTGTVIVEAPPGRGPRTRKQLLTEADIPKELPPDVAVLEGSRLGATEGRRGPWRIWWSDIGGERHPSVHMREADAAAHLAQLLEMQMEKLHAHASAEAMYARDPERKAYAEAGIALVFHIRNLLAAKRPWEAYEDWLRFEEEFSDAFDIPLEILIGTIRAEAA